MKGNLFRNFSDSDVLNDFVRKQIYVKIFFLLLYIQNAAQPHSIIDRLIIDQVKAMEKG